MRQQADDERTEKEWRTATVGVSKELWQALMDFRYNNRIPNMSTAIRLLVQRGLECRDGYHGKGDS